MATTSTSQFITRACGLVLLAVTVAYLLFAVLPFYANGIHLRSYQEIGGSLVDVKGYPPFTWLGGPAQAIAMLSAVYIPWVGAALVPILVVALAVRWRSFRAGEAWLWLAVSMATIAAVALTWPVHAILMTWLVD